MIVITLLTGASVFGVMESNAEAQLNKRLQLVLKGHVKYTETVIGIASERSVLIATHPLLINLLQLAGAGDTAAQSELNMSDLPIVENGHTAIALYGEDGQELTRTGVFAKNPQLIITLNNPPGSAQLIWDGQLLLRTTVEMKKEERIVGTVMTETRLPAIMDIIKEATDLGETEDIALCARYDLSMQCLPTTLTPRTLIVPQRTPDGTLLPMAHALEGRTGFIITKDYRNQTVTAAYAPVGDLGLGMVLKMDSAELRAPIWNQLRTLIPLLAGMVILALLLLRWRLSPLVVQLVRAETESAERTTSLTLANVEKDKRAVELTLANAEKDKRAEELTEEVAERKHAENTIRQFKTTLDLSTDGIRMFWPDTLEYFYTNQTSIDMTGLTEEEIIGSTPANIIPGFDEKAFRETCRSHG